MTAKSPRFRASYGSAFRAYLLDASEAPLRTAYELGRDAVAEELSVLDLAAVHHDALLSELLQSQGAAEVERVTRSAAEFFLESISAFEMVQRGFREARDAALLERRQAMMLRQLSNLLADASLTLDAPDSFQEMLQLVVEQARELIGADHCVAAVAFEGEPHLTRAVSSSVAETNLTALLGTADLSAISQLAVAKGGSMRMSGAECADHPVLRTLASSSEPEPGSEPTPWARGWLVAQLTALDGAELGSIHVFGSHDGCFTELEQAILVNLAQMASAAVERAWLYRRARKRVASP